MKSFASNISHPPTGAINRSSSSFKTTSPFRSRPHQIIVLSMRPVPLFAGISSTVAVSITTYPSSFTHFSIRPDVLRPVIHPSRKIIAACHVVAYFPWRTQIWTLDRVRHDVRVRVRLVLRLRHTTTNV